MQTAPFWTDDFPRPTDLPVQAPPERTDVAIVGSGYTGLSAARVLARAGYDVTVLDAETIGWGASSRNGGMMTTGLKDDAQHICKQYGNELGRRLWEWSLDAVDFVEKSVGEAGIDCDFARRGYLYLAYKPGHVEAMQESVAWHARQLDYHDMHFVPREELSEEIGTAAYFGGVVDSRAAGLHPAKYVFGLARIAAAEGVRLAEQSPVTAIDKAGEEWRLEISSKRSLYASQIFIATNGYTTDVLPYIRNGVFPVGSYIITTEPLSPALQAELSPRGRMFVDSKNFLNYFRLTPDGRMLFGGRHNLSPNLDVTESAHMMRRRMLEVFPQLADAAVSHTWSGNLGLTFDLMPHAGRIASGPHAGIAYAYGYAGHGVAVASYLGHEIGRMLSGERASVTFADIRQQRYFFTRYDSLYLPFVSAWFRILDRVR
ncbi:MAG: FAD-binding oxidoreductase [Caldilineaceae bacterium]|nr:FAD-binding oxidoreductase [Caldilineaceae bacterium]